MSTVQSEQEIKFSKTQKVASLRKVSFKSFKQVFVVLNKRI